MNNYSMLNVYSARLVISMVSASLALFVGCTPATTMAAPRGVVMAPEALQRGDRTRLVRQIRTARLAHPRAFRAVAELRGRLPSLDRRPRGRMLDLVRPLRALGADGLMPMLQELATDGTEQGELSRWAWDGWRVSLLEAVGGVGDAKATPVLRVVVLDSDKDPSVRRAAARALCEVGYKADQLVDLTRGKDGEVPQDLIPALGHCREPAMARHLGTMLAAAKAERAVSVLGALGQLGNAWAWQTPKLARGKQGEATRRQVMKTVVGAYAGLDDEGQKAAIKALALVGHKATFTTIEARAEKATPSQAKALTDLARRLKETGILK